MPKMYDPYQPEQMTPMMGTRKAPTTEDMLNPYLQEGLLTPHLRGKMKAQKKSRDEIEVLIKAFLDSIGMGDDKKVKGN